MSRNSQCGGFDPQFAIHLCRRTLHGLPANDGRHSNDRFLYMFNDLEDWIDTHPGIRRANEDDISRLDRFVRPGRRFRCLDSLESETLHPRLTATVYEIFLKCQVALLRLHNCPDWLV